MSSRFGFFEKLEHIQSSFFFSLGSGGGRLGDQDGNYSYRDPNTKEVKKGNIHDDKSGSDESGSDEGGSDESEFESSFEEATREALERGHSLSQAIKIGQMISGVGPTSQNVSNALRNYARGRSGGRSNTHQRSTSVYNTQSPVFYSNPAMDKFNDVLRSFSDPHSLNSKLSSERKKGATITKTHHLDGSTTYHISRPGLFNDTVYHANPSGVIVEGGVVSANLVNEIGMHGATAISIAAVGAIALGVVTRNYTATIEPVADLLALHGAIEQEVHNTLVAVGEISGFMHQSVSRTQTLSAIGQAYRQGLTTNIGRIAYAGASLYGQYRAIGELEEKLGTLGVAREDIDLLALSGGGFHESEGKAFLGSVELTIENWQEKVSSSVQKYYLSKVVLPQKAILDDFMAGSTLYNDTWAGGSLFDPNLPVGDNLLASVTGRASTNTISEMVLLQEDFIKMKFLKGD